MKGTPGRALIAVDFVNEIVDPRGKLSGKGYGSFLGDHGTLDRVEALLAAAREAEIPIFHVRIGFSADYREQPEQSPLFGPARKNNVFQADTWATEFHPKARPAPGETQILKRRVSAFYGTPLDLTLRNMGVREIWVSGVATDLAVQSLVREAHDRDYIVTVVGDCCASSSTRDHEDALRLLGKVATVTSLGEVDFRG